MYNAARHTLWLRPREGARAAARIDENTRARDPSDTVLRYIGREAWLGPTPMTEELDTAQRFRLRAEEVRTIAEDVRDKAVKESLIRIAADYDKMAETLVAIDGTRSTTTAARR